MGTPILLACQSWQFAPDARRDEIHADRRDDEGPDAGHDINAGPAQEALDWHPWRPPDERAIIALRQISRSL
nr:hypothetical protein [Bradyrhizobium shewense]